MTVRDLLRRLANLDGDALVEFRDVTYGRECPVNSLTLEPGREKSVASGRRVVLSNRLGS